MVSAVRAELSKVLTLRSAWIVAGAIVALHVLITLANVGNNVDAVAAITPDGRIEIFAGQPRPAEAALVEVLITSTLQMCLFLPVLGAVLAGSEFRGGQLGASLLAVPHRITLVLAKTVAISVHLFGVALVVAAVSTAGVSVAVGDRFPGLLRSADALRGQAAVLLFLVLSALVGASLTLIVRSTLVGVFATVAVLAVTMTQVLAVAAPWLDALFPLSAGRNLLLDPADSVLTAGPAHALAVLVVWPVVTTAVAGVMLSRRDAR